jgi:integrase
MPKAKKPQASHQKHCTAEDLEVFINDGLLEYNAHTEEGRKVGQDVHLAIRLMEYLGLRPQEAFAVCAEDIDLEHGLIRIQRSVGSDANNKRQLIATKTGESVRVLPIPAALEPYIRELLTHDTRPLLMDVDGLPYDTSKISTLLCNVSNAKKVPHINQYMLRHMFGTDMTKQDLKVAQSMMGHENPEQTLQYAKESSIAEMADALKNRRFS